MRSGGSGSDNRKAGRKFPRAWCLDWGGSIASETVINSHGKPNSWKTTELTTTQSFPTAIGNGGSTECRRKLMTYICGRISHKQIPLLHSHTVLRAVCTWPFGVILWLNLCDCFSMANIETQCCVQLCPGQIQFGCVPSSILCQLPYEQSPLRPGSGTKLKLMMISEYQTTPVVRIVLQSNWCRTLSFP